MKYTRIKTKRHKLALTVIIVLLALAGIGYALHSKKSDKQPVTANQYTKGEQAAGRSNAGDTATGSSSTQVPPSSDNNKNSPNSGATGTLLAPTGNFVSNHDPNLGGHPAPNTETSVCNTTPGATCQITFTKGSTVKSLSAITADSGGAAYWNWKLQTAGLTAGTWQIKAVAKLGGQTKTATDAMNLVVSP